MKFDDHWEVHDPDGVWDYDSFEDVDEIIKSDSGEIVAREDLFFLTNSNTGISIDCGFYGDEVSLQGVWVIYVINTKLDEPWDKPIDRVEHAALSKALYKAIELVKTYQ